MRTRPSRSSVAVWFARLSRSDPVGLMVAVPGSHTSADARTASERPPTMRTRPSRRSVAVWSARASASDPAKEKAPLARSHTTIEARDPSSSPVPPTMRTRPSRQKRRGVVRACLGERSRRAEGPGGRIPQLGGGAHAAARGVATGDQDAIVGQQGGGVTEASVREGTRRVEALGDRIPQLGGGASGAGSHGSHPRPAHGHHAAASRCGSCVPH